MTLSMKLLIAFALIWQIAKTDDFLSSLGFGSTKNGNQGEGNAVTKSDSGTNGDILTAILGGSDRGKQPDIFEQIGAVINGMYVLLFKTILI